MKRSLAAVLAMAVAGALFVAGPLVAAPKGTENYNKSDTTVTDCGDGRSIAITAPEKLWPPNHKYYDDLAVTATDDGGGRVELVTTGTHNQYDGDTEANGAGNTADDIRSNPEDEGATVKSSEGASTFIAEEGGNGSVTTDWQARAERAGTIMDAREYVLTAEATFTSGEPCHAEARFAVPHDMRPSNR